MTALKSLIPRRGRSHSIKWSAVRFMTLRWAALPITDRRWTAPLSAAAVGMGLFVGVAIGPGTESSLGIPAKTIVVVQSARGEPQSLQTADSASKPGRGAAATPPEIASPAPSGPNPPVVPPPSTPSPSVTPVPTPPAAAPVEAEETTAATTDAGDETTTTQVSEPEPLVLKGTVVHVNRLAGSYALASRTGEISAIHSFDLPRVGNRLEVPVRALANETYAEEGRRKRTETVSSARVQGVVTYADRATAAYTVSAVGASLLIHPDPADQSPPAPPAVGSQVTASVAFGERADEGVAAPPTVSGPPTTTTPVPVVPRRSGACGDGPAPPRAPDAILTERSRRVDGDFVADVDLEGIVQGVCQDGRELVLSADDLDEAAADVVVRSAADSGLDLSSLRPGNVVTASATIERGTRDLELTAVASDDGVKGADATQGDESG
jgi:hypothetical protein